MEKNYQVHIDLYRFIFSHLFFGHSTALQKSYMKNWRKHWPNSKSTEINRSINGSHRIWVEAIVLII